MDPDINALRRWSSGRSACGAASRLCRTLGLSVCLALGSIGIVPPIVAAYDSWISTSAIERALVIARSSNAERARFHSPYIADVNVAILTAMVLARIEVVTEFRRMELIAEDHVALGDGFGRGGIADAKAALAPWRNKVSVVAHLRFAFPTQSALFSLPSVYMRMETPVLIEPVSTERHMTKGSGGVPIAGTVTAVFAADKVTSRSTAVLIERNGRFIARVPINLNAVR